MTSGTPLMLTYLDQNWCNHMTCFVYEYILKHNMYNEFSPAYCNSDVYLLFDMKITYLGRKPSWMRWFTLLLSFFYLHFAVKFLSYGISKVNISGSHLTISVSNFCNNTGKWLILKITKCFIDKKLKWARKTIPRKNKK